MKIFILKEIPQTKPKKERKGLLKVSVEMTFQKDQQGFFKDKATQACAKTCLLGVN